MSEIEPWLRSMSVRGGKGVIDGVDARSLGRAADEIARLTAKSEADEEMLTKVQDAILGTFDEIAALRAQLAEAVGLLKPFAEEASHWAAYSDRSSYGSNKVLYVVDLRRAREFIERVGK